MRIMKTLLEILTEYEEACIIRWRKGINKFMEREYGFTLKFYPEIKGEEN